MIFHELTLIVVSCQDLVTGYLKILPLYLTRRSQDLKINNKSIPSKGNVNWICVAVKQMIKISTFIV